jgi:hypothetical protein
MMLQLLLRQSLSRRMSQRKKKRKLPQRLLKSQSKSQSQSQKLQRLRKLNQLPKRNLMKARLQQLPMIPQSLKARTSEVEVDVAEAVAQDQTEALEAIEEPSVAREEPSEVREELTEAREELTEEIGVIEEEVAEEEAKTGEEEMVRTTKASSLSKKMATPEEEVEAEATEVEEIEETEVTEAPGEVAMRMVKVTSEVAQDHQEVTDLQELEPTRRVIFQELPLQLLIQNQFLTSSECPELLLGIC